jgi:hypothetical protein
MSKMKMKDCIELLQFESLVSFVDYCDSVTSSNFSSGKQSSNTGSVKFTGTKSYEHASELVRSGWKEGVRKVHAQMNVIAQNKDSVEMMESAFDIQGVVPIVPAYLNGDPECMYNPCQYSDKPIVNVVVEVSASCGIDKEWIINRGAAILMFCAALEENGQRVAIHASNFARSGGTFHGQLIQVKAAELDFNLHSLSYALVSPSMLRRHAFRCTENLPEHADLYQSGYGQTMAISDIEGYGSALGDVDLHIPVIEYSGYETVEDAVESIDRLAKAQGLIQ